MKKIICKLLPLLLVFTLMPLTVSAHNGKTDAYGGHYDRSTGEYHYHHGFPAHQHYDTDGDGSQDCPYDYADQTNRSDGSSSGAYHYSAAASDVSKPPGSNAVAKEKAVPVYRIPIWAFGILTLFSAAIVILALTLKSKINALQAKTASHRKELQENRTALRKKLLELDVGFQSIRGPDYLYFLLDVPEGDSVGSDGLPRHTDSTPHMWGEKYTFYISDSGKKYHTVSCRYSGSIPINAYYLHGSRNLEPCSFCRPSLPDMQWYIQFRKIQRFKESYMNEQKDRSNI